MPRIIIAGASEASRSKLCGLLAASGFSAFRACASGGELRRTLNACDDGIVLLVGALPDCLPDDLAEDFGDSFQLLLIGRPEVLSGCESHRIFKLAYPCAGSAVMGAVEVLSQLHDMRMPRRTGEDKLQVDRAKALLMRERGVTEAEAHRLMQVHAMKHNMKMTDYAAELLQGSEGTEV